MRSSFRYSIRRTAARAADERQARGESLGPLHGVPITVKDMFDVVGAPTTAGLATRRGHEPARDAVVVARLKNAGAVVLGKTNVPQLGMLPDANNSLYGRTLNPWNPNRTPGGSSGGEAAIIAAGGSPLGLGATVVAAFANLVTVAASAGSNRLADVCPSAATGMRRTGRPTGCSPVRWHARSMICGLRYRYCKTRRVT